MSRYILIVDTDSNPIDLNEAALFAEIRLADDGQHGGWTNLSVVAYDDINDVMADLVANEGPFDPGPEATA